jgi:hypothetical protein
LDFLYDWTGYSDLFFHLDVKMIRNLTVILAFLIFGESKAFAITTWICEKDSATYKFMFDDQYIYVDFGRTTDKYKITERTDKILRNERNNAGTYNDVKIYLNERNISWWTQIKGYDGVLKIYKNCKTQN